MGTTTAAISLQDNAKPREIPPRRAYLVSPLLKNRQNTYKLRVTKKTKKLSRIALLEIQRMIGELDHKETATKPK